MVLPGWPPTGITLQSWQIWKWSRKRSGHLWLR